MWCGIRWVLGAGRRGRGGGECRGSRRLGGRLLRSLIWIVLPRLYIHLYGVVLILCDIVLYVLLYCYDDYNDNDGSVSISNMISSIQS
jgi:hypothetical protein